MSTTEYWNWKQINEEKYGFEEVEYDDNDDEALSLCDLALNNTNNIAASDYDDSSKEDQSSSCFDEDENEDIFQFFSEDFITTTTSAATKKDNIIFCGKLIPYKGEKELDKPKESEINNMRSCIFPWKSFSLKGSKRDSTKNIQQRAKSCRINTSKCDVSMKKQASLLASSATKSRWSLFAFGMGRSYPVEMELNDLKTRQSKSKTTTAAAKSPQKTAAFRRHSGWWSLVRILGCQSSHAGAMVKASLGLMPLPSEREEFKRN